MAYLTWLYSAALILSLLLSFFVLPIRADPDESLVYNFVTRPDLQAPRWNVTVFDQDQLSPGYFFVAPYSQLDQKRPGRGWVGPHIYDPAGQLIWSGADRYSNMSVHDFRLNHVNGRDRFTLIEEAERAVYLLDYDFGRGENILIDGLNMHDLNFVQNGTRALVLIRGARSSSREDARSTGLKNGLCKANFHEIREFDTKTWNPTWSWSSWGKIGLNESRFAYGPAEARCSGVWDYLHANAVDQCPDGDILLSGRHTDAIYKISRSTGKIVWRLGGDLNDFSMLNGLNFSRQHDVRCRAQNETTTTITLLDNAKGEDPKEPTSALSRGLRIALNTATMEASLVQAIDHPAGRGGYSFRRGSYQELPNNNVLMGWSENSLMTEHSPSGKMLMKAVMAPDWIGTYRSYKFDFVGRPNNPPDLFAQAVVNQDENGRNRTTMRVYVSWNGATDIATWKLYKSTETGEAATLLAVQARQDFETTIVYQGYAANVYAVAMDAHGAVLGRSRIIRTIPPSDFDLDAAEEQRWLQKMSHVPSGQQADKKGLAISLVIGRYDVTAFAAGFALCAMLIFMAFMLYRTCWAGRSLPQMKLMWHRNVPYRKLDEPEDGEGGEIEILEEKMERQTTL